MITTELSRRLRELGVLSNGINPREMRMVTHKDVPRRACELALGAVCEAIVGTER
jgi:hypothetical protein